MNVFFFMQGQPPEGTRRPVSEESPLVLTRKFPVGWLKVTFQGEGEAIIGVGIGS